MPPKSEDDTAPQATAKPPGVVAFYDGTRFLLDNGNDYVPMDRRSFKAHLQQAFVPDPEAEICRVQVENFVRYAGPIAGHRRGPLRSGNALLLVTSAPTIIKSEPGPFPTITAFLDALLGGGEHGDRQTAAFMGWLHIGRMALLAAKRRPGQALVLAGGVGTGKTQLIKQLIAPSMGGRTGSPYRYLTGKTNFNGDLIGAETLVIDDECGSVRADTRRALGEGIKHSLFATKIRAEAKHKTGFDVSPLWRICVAVNDEPESLLVLPQLADTTIEDKLILLKCNRAVPANADFEDWERQIAAELPAFLHAVENYRIDPADAEPRCGVRVFWHPEIVAAVSEMAPEAQLVQLVDAASETGSIALPWTGTAAALKALLCSPSASTRHDAERLLGSWPAACGVYLSRLEGHRVMKLPMRDGIQNWRIDPPSSGQVETNSNNQTSLFR